MIIVTPYNKALKIFLAGPIKGAPDWHEDLMSILKELNVILLSPKTKQEDDFDYDTQVGWETENLENADYIIFYLAKEKDIIPNRSYAQTTRFELGENLARIYHTKTNQKVFIYGEEGFHGLSYIEKKAKSPYYESFTQYFDNKEKFLEALIISIVKDSKL